MGASILERDVFKEIAGGGCQAQDHMQLLSQLFSERRCMEAALLYISMCRNLIVSYFSCAFSLKGDHNNNGLNSSISHGMCQMTERINMNQDTYVKE